ncbi:uncharacterized protein TNCV_4303171 [Trichonephila clavipes]|nr:uncharacterized protein TNCV_4303171 [Trichonephila clavipes]
MSPIKHVWDLVGRCLALDSRPAASKDEFLLRIQAILNSLPQVDIQNLFDSMPRRIAALIAAHRTFDILGLLGPVISKVKFFMQQLWLLKLEWHEKLPVPVAAEWASFVQSLPVFGKAKIPRFVLSENLESIILYGFSDASEKGFGAVNYVSVIKKKR